MVKLQKNQPGFVAVEAGLVLVIVFLIGVVGWMAYKNYHKTTTAAATTNTPTTSTKPSTPDPYAGWKSAGLQYEQIAYKHPSDWTVTDNSLAVPKSQNGCTYPGHDLVTLNSPTGSQVTFNAGQDCFGDASATAFGTMPINALGQNIYLAFEGNNGINNATSPSDACLSPTTNPYTSFLFKSKNIFSKGGGSSDNTPVNSFCYIPYNPSNYQNSAPPTFSVDQIKSSKDFNTAVLIFESMHY